MVSFLFYNIYCSVAVYIHIPENIWMIVRTRLKNGNGRLGDLKKTRHGYDSGNGGH